MKLRASLRFTGRLVPALSCFILLLPACAASGPSLRVTRNETTPLDRYVAAPDPAYAWEPVHDVEGEGCAAHVLKMTSQTWLTSEEVDHTTWWHWLTIVEPERVASDIALLYIHSGDNEDGPPDRIRPAYEAIARSTGTVVAELRMVPNQPLQFRGDPAGPRREDRLIAYAWDRFLRSGDPVWLPRLPMTKSVVRAMDTISAYFERRGEGGPRIGRFVVAGASKRGWATWTTAIVDRRVVAIVPMVIDLLNLEVSFRHHFGAYGFWAPAIQSYVEMGIPGWFGTPQMRRLREIVDPYEYRSRLTMPKLVINATGDQFFVPDSSRFYFADLPGENLLRYVPNADHSMRRTDVDESVLAFYRSIVADERHPSFTWTFEPDGSIKVETRGSPAPSAARLWQATNPAARDFRIETLGPVWTSSDLVPRADGEYVARAADPASGWTAFFVELTYPGKSPPPLKLTTEVRIIPDTLPFAGAER